MVFSSPPGMAAVACPISLARFSVLGGPQPDGFQGILIDSPHVHPLPEPGLVKRDCIIPKFFLENLNR